MKQSIYLALFMLMLSCDSKGQKQEINSSMVSENMIQLYKQKYREDSLPSKSLGTVSNGQLVNGKLIPFQGSNFHYFDTTSYINNRAFVNDKVRSVVTATYKNLEKLYFERQFCIMECSNREGGKLFPHRTHQNGLSIDFMMPLQKGGNPYYVLDSLGASHYWLEFDNNGHYSKDDAVTIDFDLIAHHILLLEQQARKNGLKVSKVIMKVELMDELYATVYGKQLKSKGIYFAQKLTPLINSLHDDHYHVDFELLK